MNKEIEAMQRAWGSKHELLTDIVHTIKAITGGTHRSMGCRFCEKADSECSDCPVPVMLGRVCCDFRAFYRYFRGSRRPIIITAIINKLTRLAFRVAQLEDW